MYTQNVQHNIKHNVIAAIMPVFLYFLDIKIITAIEIITINPIVNKKRTLKTILSFDD